MICAADFAECIGLAFNRHWTVHYQLAGIAEHDGAAFVGRLLALVRKHIKRQGLETAALWARENGEGKGGHVHILLHVPAGMTLRNLTRRWIKSAGGTAARRASRVRTVGGTVARSHPASGAYRANSDAVLAYIIKGADPATGEGLSLPRFGEAGLILGKRAGWTQNIGAASQRAWRSNQASLERRERRTAIAWEEQHPVERA